MFRKTTWRNTVSEAVSFHQDQALNTTILLLKSFGPTGFLLREEGEDRNLKVCLGDPHTCTCPVFIREKEPCKHICWVLLRKFKLPREHEYSFQSGLVERQILEMLHGLHQTKVQRKENDPSTTSGTPNQPSSGREAGSVCRKAVQAEDVCPICQEELLEKKLPVSYCRFGCGNNVHVSCMKVWAAHQRLSDTEETVKCPLCREDFSSTKLLQDQVKNTAKLFTAAERERPERHLGVSCHSCRICPVSGKCYKCAVCSFFFLCEDCSKSGCHQQHPLAFRKKRTEPWLIQGENSSDGPAGGNSPADLLISTAADPLPKRVLVYLPWVRVRPGSRLLDVGLQCRICLQDFNLGQHVRTLPCLHKFHSDCVDRILRKSSCCPLDGFIVYDPVTWRIPDRKSPSKPASCQYRERAKPSENKLQDLFVPGVALRNPNIPPSHGSLKLEVILDPAAASDTWRKFSEDEGGSQRKETPQSSSSPSKSNSRTKHSPASANQSPAETNIGEQRQLKPSVGFKSPRSDQTATAASAVRQTGLKP